MVVLVLPFTFLTTAKKHQVQQQEGTTSNTKHRVRGIDESNLSYCGLKTLLLRTKLFARLESICHFKAFKVMPIERKHDWLKQNKIRDHLSFSIYTHTHVKRDRKDSFG